MEGDQSDQQAIKTYLTSLDGCMNRLIDCMQGLDSYYLSKAEKPLIHFDIYTARVVLSDLVGEYLALTSREGTTLGEIAAYVGRCQVIMQRITASIGSLLDQADESCHIDTPALNDFISVVNEAEHSLGQLFGSDLAFAECEV